MTPQKIPTTVVTGFLGAGKTTLIQHLLNNAGGRRIALVVNEFGDAGVDGDVLKSCGIENCSDDDIVELANGCICCTVADDFVPAMTKLIERTPAPDHIVIETSGLALPQPLVKAFKWPEIGTRVTVDGVVTVVDGEALAAGRFAHDHDAVEKQREDDPELDHETPLEELFEDQLNCADLVLLNKSDLLEADVVNRLGEDLSKTLRKGAKLVPIQHGQVGSDVLLGLEAAAEDDNLTRQSHHEQHGEEDHDHDDFESFVVKFGEAADRAGILRRIAQAIADHDILRLKGFVSLDGNQSRLLIQAVGPRIDSYFDRPWSQDEPRQSSLVVIGMKGLDQAAISSALTG